MSEASTTVPQAVDVSICTHWMCLVCFPPVLTRIPENISDVPLRNLTRPSFSIFLMASRSFKRIPDLTGLLESTYETCLAYELTNLGLAVERQKELPVKYRDVRLDCGYRIDLLVEDKVIVELKAVERLEPIHIAQVLSYLKLSGCKVGLLINFNVKVLKNGIRRLIND